MPFKDPIKAKEYRKRWRAKNTEKVKVYARTNYLRHKDKAHARSAKWAKNNIDKVRIRQHKYDENRKESKRQYAIANADHIRQRKKNYYQNNKEKIKIYKRIKRKTNLLYKLADNLRARTNIAIRNNTKAGSAVRDLGCSILEFKMYIEQKFKNGMSWSNHAIDGWHLDHIIPLAKFNLANREEFLKAAHYTNYQPLWAVENIRKSDSYE